MPFVPPHPFIGAATSRDAGPALSAELEKPSTPVTPVLGASEVQSKEAFATDVSVLCSIARENAGVISEADREKLLGDSRLCEEVLAKFPAAGFPYILELWRRVGIPASEFLEELAVSQLWPTVLSALRAVHDFPGTTERLSARN